MIVVFLILDLMGTSQYRINKNSSLTLKVGAFNEPLNISNLYSNPITNNYQTSSINSNEFRFIKKNEASLNYKYYNLLKEYNIDFIFKYKYQDFSFINDLSFDIFNTYILNTTVENRKRALLESSAKLDFM